MSRFIKNVAWLQSSTIVIQLIAFFVNVLLFRELGDVGYGLYSVIFVLLNSVGIFLFWDPGNALVHAIARSKDQKEKESISLEGWTISLISSCVYSFSLFLISSTLLDLYLAKYLTDTHLSLAKSLELKRAIQLSCFIPLLSCPTQWALNLLRGLEKMREASILLTCHNLARSLGALVGYLISPNFAVILLCILGLHCANLILSFICLNKHFSNTLKKIFSLTLKKPRRKLLQQSFLVTIDKKYTDWLDLLPKQILAFHPNILAYYEIIQKLIAGALQVTAPISSALLPRLTKISQEKEKTIYLKRMQQVARTGFILGLCLATVLGVMCWQFILPEFYQMSQSAITAVGQAGLAALVAFPAMGFGIIASSCALIQNKMLSLLLIKVIFSSIFIPGAWYLIEKYHLLGACLYWSFHKISINFAGYLILMRDATKSIREVPSSAIEKSSQKGRRLD